MANVCFEGHELISFLQSLYVFFSGHSHGGDILFFKGSNVTSKALPFVKLSYLIYSVHLLNIVR